MSSTVHPLVAKLVERRRILRLSQRKVAEVARISDNFISNHEHRKFTSLVTFDRWCQALGFRIELVDLEEERRASDWYLLVG